MRNSNPLSIYFILQKINDTNQSNLSKLQQHAVYLLNINNIVIGLLPIILRPWCRVANIRKSIMVLETANASWLMRLRHEKTQLLYNLRSKILPSLSYIDIRIQPSLAIKRNISRSKPYSVLFNGKIEQQTPRNLSVNSAKLIRNLAANSEGKLQIILERLAMLAVDNNHTNSK